MARCGCSGTTCSCLVTGDGTYTTVTGSGSVLDPYIVHGAAGALGVVDTTYIDLTLTGSGTIASPWSLTAALKTFNLGNLSDVNAPTPTNGYVLAWNSSTSKWVPVPAATASPGVINSTLGVTGDGSSGTPLKANLLSTGRLRVTSNQLDISLDTYARLSLSYASAAARDTQYTTWGIAAATGHQAWLNDRKTLTIYDGSVWYEFTPGVGTSWQFNRVSSNGVDVFSGYAGLAGGTLTAALAGRYKITWSIVIASNSASIAPGYGVVKANGTEIESIPYDLGLVYIPGGSTFIYTHAGGTLALELGYSGGAARCDARGTRMVIEYLGR
jgi:hypothetical protein